MKLLNGEVNMCEKPECCGKDGSLLYREMLGVFLRHGDGSGLGDTGNGGGGNTPTNPTDPTDPIDPVDPTDPVDPIDPIDPVPTETTLRVSPIVTSKFSSDFNGSQMPVNHVVINAIGDIQDQVTNVSIQELYDFAKSTAKTRNLLQSAVHATNNALYIDWDTGSLMRGMTAAGSVVSQLWSVLYNSASIPVNYKVSKRPIETMVGYIQELLGMFLGLTETEVSTTLTEPTILHARTHYVVQYIMDSMGDPVPGYFSFEVTYFDGTGIKRDWLSIPYAEGATVFTTLDQDVIKAFCDLSAGKYMRNSGYFDNNVASSDITYDFGNFTGSFGSEGTYSLNTVIAQGLAGGFGSEGSLTAEQLKAFNDMGYAIANALVTEDVLDEVLAGSGLTPSVPKRFFNILADAQVTGDFTFTPVNGDPILIPINGSTLVAVDDVPFDAGTIIVRGSDTYALNAAYPSMGDVLNGMLIHSLTAAQLDVGNYDIMQWYVDGRAVSTGKPFRIEVSTRTDATIQVRYRTDADIFDTTEYIQAGVEKEYIFNSPLALFEISVEAPDGYSITEFSGFDRNAENYYQSDTFIRQRLSASERNLDSNYLRSFGVTMQQAAAATVKLKFLGSNYTVSASLMSQSDFSTQRFEVPAGGEIVFPFTANIWEGTLTFNADDGFVFDGITNNFGNTIGTTGGNYVRYSMSASERSTAVTIDRIYTVNTVPVEE